MRNERGPWRRVETVLIGAVALHSVGIGLGALVATEWGVRFSGFEGAFPLFFPRQVGVFHVVIGLAYLIEYFRYQGISILLVAKGSAVLFLSSMVVVDQVPWVVPFSAGVDGLMGLAVFLVHRKAGTRSPFG